MSVDVLYAGTTLQRSVPVRPAPGGGYFVALDAPMPVGTRLELEDPDAPGEPAEVVVTRVHESEGESGVAVRVERGTVDATEELEVDAEPSAGDSVRLPPPLPTRAAAAGGEQDF